MAAATIVKLGRILLVTLQDDDGGTEAGAFVGMVGDQVVAHAASGVLIDVSALSLVDSFVVRTLANLVGATRLLGAEAIIAGMRPEVAIAMVELGAELPDVASALTVDIGMSRLRERAGCRD